MGAAASRMPGLRLEEWAKLIWPPALYYRHKIVRDILDEEPELAHFDTLVPTGCTAIDIGANRGVFAFAMSRQAARVEAFEPFPPLARFARIMLGKRATVHAVALADTTGTAAFHIAMEPDRNRVDHYRNSMILNDDLHTVPIEVPVRTLDSYYFREVGFIKVDVEGAEEMVLAGGRTTIMRDRPVMLVELLTPWTPDPPAAMKRIAGEFGYSASILADGAFRDAATVLEQTPQPDWTRNILFRPEEMTT